jgi:hypothetical protein
MLLVEPRTENLSPGHVTSGTHRRSTGFDVRRVRRPCKRCPRHLPLDLVHQRPFDFASEDLLSLCEQCQRGRGSLRKWHPLSTSYTSRSSFTRTPTRPPIISSEVFLPFSMWFITCDSKAAPYSELDQAKCRVIWISPARSLQDHDRLLDTTLKADMVIGARGGHEDSSLGDEDDGSYREVVKHEPRPTL